MWKIIAFVFACLIYNVSADNQYKLCVPESVTPTQCINLEQGNSKFKCERVSDSADCSLKLSNNRADFGIFNSQELLLMHQFYKTDLKVIAQIRHREKSNDEFEFETVAIVPSSYGNLGTFSHLFKKGFCHPGFNKNQNWNDFILKLFEQRVMNILERKEYSVLENELINLREYFQRSCRPGDWVPDEKLDATLKKKYPQLCELCDFKNNCTYSAEDPHIGALNCLISGRGGVAYTSLHHARKFFKEFSCETYNDISILRQNTEDQSKLDQFKFLCKDGTVQSLNQQNPCTWFKQSWEAIVMKDNSEELRNDLKNSLTSGKESTLKNIILGDSTEAHFYDVSMTPAVYLEKAGQDNSKLPELSGSGMERALRWCTTSPMEQSKCEWLTAEALILGIAPQLKCSSGSNSSFQCFRNIEQGRADFIAIDSNYGYLARKFFHLKPVLFAETRKKSVVLAVTKEKSSDFTSEGFSGLRQRNACFPEYGGIAWLALVNVLREHRLLVDSSCEYAHLLAKFLHGGCAPGARDTELNLSVPKEAAEVLCRDCPDNTCSANYKNRYFGDRGAMECLNGPGDIAFIEYANIIPFVKNGSIVEREYRVLCKNGSLARNPGFEVDEQCALSVTVDSEVIARGSESLSRVTDIKLALLQIEERLGYHQNIKIPIKAYHPFNNTLNLLFKDSTIKLFATSEQEIKTILAYKELFSHVDKCTKSAGNKIFVNSFYTTSLLLIVAISFM